MKKIIYLTTVAIFLTTHLVFSQQCHDYACVITKVEKLMKQSQKDYKVILDNLDSAEGYPNSKSEQIRGLRRKVFVLIENEKNEAKIARDEAKRQTEIAQNVLDQMGIEKFRAIVEKRKVQLAEAQAKAVIDKIYFYNDEFGLAYDRNNELYGFIDRNFNTKIAFEFEEALPFDNTGYAKVKKNNTYYLIDTLGNRYNLATDINQLDTTILALDLRDKILKDIPPTTFKFKQLKILLLSSNQLTILPDEIGALNQLVFLDLSDNKIKTLPVEIKKLNQLKYLSLEINSTENFALNVDPITYELKIKEKNMVSSFSNDEKEKIKQLLPNCLIRFYPLFIKKSFSRK
jgi:hypothetical protein